MTTTSRNVGMVLPPLGPTTGGVDRETADLADVRVPAPFGRYDDEHWARPVGYYQGRLEPGGTARHTPGPCNPTGAWGDNRHLFDALMSEEGDVYVGDDLAPSRFRLVLTCVRCGAVRALTGQLEAEGGDRDVAVLDPVPLQVSDLLAQQISYSRSWGHDDAEWTVYRDGQRVGWMATSRGRRGARYVMGGLGRRYRDDHLVVKAPTPTAVLRKLAKLQVNTVAQAQ